MGVSRPSGHLFEDISLDFWVFHPEVDTAHRDLANMGILLAQSLEATDRILRMAKISTQQLLPSPEITKMEARNIFYHRHIPWGITRRWRVLLESCAPSSLMWRIHPLQRDKTKRPRKNGSITYGVLRRRCILHDYINDEQIIPPFTTNSPQ